MSGLPLILLLIVFCSEGFSFPTNQNVFGAWKKIFRDKKNITNTLKNKDDDIKYNEISKCLIDEFECSLTSQCIPLEDKCDNRVDCYDRSDESWETCDDKGVRILSDEECKFNRFFCRYSGECIPTTFACDGYTDCDDRTDETFELCVLHTKKHRHIRGEYTWHVSISSSSGTHRCGGSIINNRWILTAAHCTEYPDWALSFQVTAGEYNKSFTSGREQHYKIEKVINHSGYLPHSGEGYKGVYVKDISLIKVTEPIQFNDYIQPIALPFPYQKSKGIGRIAGWGARWFKGRTRKVLRELVLPIVSDKVCLKYFQQSVIFNNTICAGGLKTRKSGCHGDSGGGLICKDDSGDEYLCGVASFIELDYCNDMEDPTVFSEVSYYIDWIKKVISEN